MKIQLSSSRPKRQELAFMAKDRTAARAGRSRREQARRPHSVRNTASSRMITSGRLTGMRLK